MLLKKAMINGMMWTSVDKFGVQFIQFIFSIIIARILSPEDYGTIGLLTIFITISQVFIESGFGKALIQNNKPRQLDYSTVFYFNLLIGVSCYILIFLASPYIANFFNLPILKELARIISLVLIINAFNIVPNAIFSIKLHFKPLAISNGVGAIIGGAIGIIAALNGCGVWALAYMTLTTSLIIMILQWYQSKWIPIFNFSFKSIKKLYKFGGNILVGSLIDSTVNNLNSIAIGKFFDTRSLGFYSKGLGFSNMLSNTIVSVLYTVLFPAFSIIKDDVERLLLAFKKSIRYISLIVFPIFMLVSILAKPLIIILLTEKWLTAAIILQYLVLARMINMVALVNTQVLHGMGYSRITLKQDILKTIVRVLFLFASFKFGIVWIAIADLVATIVNFFINAYFLGKILNFGAFRQIKEFGSVFISAAIASITSFVLIALFDNNYIKILLAPITLLIFYLFLLQIFGQKDFIEIKEKLLNKFLKRI